MKVVSRKLYKPVRQVLDAIQAAEGDDKGIMIAGTWVDVDERFNEEGEPEGIALLYSVRDTVDIDFIEDALEEYIDGRVSFAKILITEKAENQWRRHQAHLTRALKDFLNQQGKDEETAAMEAMFAAAEFGKITKGSGFGGAHFEDIQEITEKALRQWDDVTLKISKDGDPIYWDGHIYIKVLETIKRELETFEGLL